MSYRIFLFLVLCGTLLAWINWFVVLFTIDPEQSGGLGLVIFYIALFIALSGTIFLISNFVRRRWLSQVVVLPRVRNSFRHAIFFSILIVGWALMKSMGVLRWWNVILFILALTVLEFFFISFEKHKSIYEGGTPTT